MVYLRDWLGNSGWRWRHGSRATASGWSIWSRRWRARRAASTTPIPQPASGPRACRGRRWRDAEGGDRRGAGGVL